MSTIRCPSCGYPLASIEPPAPTIAPATSDRQPGEPLLLRIPENARLLGVSRTTAYQLVTRGRAPGGADRAGEAGSRGRSWSGWRRLILWATGSVDVVNPPAGYL